MPNAAGAAARRARKAQTANSNSGAIKVSGTLTAGEFEIQSLDNYEFTRQGAGRKRIPSPFDDVVENLVGAGTQRVPVADEDEAQEVLKNLQKSAEYHKRGLEKRVEQMEDGLFVVFKINAEKAARAPRKSRSEAVEDAETE